MNEDTRTITETDLKEAVEKTATKTNIILDATILTCLMGCGRLFDFRFNHNLQSISGKSNSLECGLIIHKFLEVYNLSIIKGLSRNQAIGYGMTSAEMYIHGCKYCTNFTSTDEQTKPTCGHQINEYEGVKNTPSDDEGYKIGWKRVLQTIEEYNEYYKNDHWIPLEVEVVKSKLIYEDDEIRVLWKAKLDLVVDTNQGIGPVDHKTMKQNRLTTNLNNQFSGQCIVMNTKRVFINKIGFQKTLPPSEKFHRDPINYSNPRLIEWQSRTVPFWAKMLQMYAESGHWPENYSNCESKYGPCAFKSVCESDPEMREEELKLQFLVGPKWNPTSVEEE